MRVESEKKQYFEFVLQYPFQPLTAMFHCRFVQNFCDILTMATFVLTNVMRLKLLFFSLSISHGSGYW